MGSFLIEIIILLFSFFSVMYEISLYLLGIHILEKLRMFFLCLMIEN